MLLLRLQTMRNEIPQRPKTVLNAMILSLEPKTTMLVLERETV